MGILYNNEIHFRERECFSCGKMFQGKSNAKTCKECKINQKLRYCESCSKIRENPHSIYCNECNPIKVKEKNERWKENVYARSNRKKLLELINKKCGLCGKEEITNIHHIKYNNLPKKNLNEYSKFLIGFCSLKCHRKYERLQTINKIKKKDKKFKKRCAK